MLVLYVKPSNKVYVSFKLDTGAECNIMSMRLANELNAQIGPTSMLLKSFGGHQLETVGKCFLNTKAFMRVRRVERE